MFMILIYFYIIGIGFIFKFYLYSVFTVYIHLATWYDEAENIFDEFNECWHELLSRQMHTIL